jgi:tetratricopeptide (TPR) repeat protein
MKKWYVLAFSLATIAASAQQHEHAAAPLEKLGTVTFTNSCNAAAQAPFNRGIALLHSFEFGRAIAAFDEAMQSDPSCGIALWGIALSRWSNPFAPGIRSGAQIAQGRDAVDRARAAGAKTERERGFLDAVALLYTDAGSATQQTRVVAYRDAMAALSARDPQDIEASIFYALALTAAEEPTDKTYASRLKAGALLERLFVQQPQHPGLAHYIIHSYDVPALADKALEAAKRYAAIAPSAPHALHMPSHTFTRVGYWQASIDANIASAEVARRDRSTAEELHAYDYQMYAYLQTAQDRAAKTLLDGLPAVAARFDPDAIGGAAPGSAGVFALAAIPARYALERQAWTEAVALEPHASKFPYAEAMTYFARGIGAAHTKNLAVARDAIFHLDEIRGQLARSGEAYWSEQVEIQRRGASAWTALAEGRADAALDEMRTAVAREDATEKSAVTPGPLAPARELLGDLLMDLKRPADSLVEYETTLKKEPNRFRALLGAARAARMSNNEAAARRYYDMLMKMCEKADSPARAELIEARAFLTPRAAR